MKAFSGMMVDGCSQVFEVAPCRAVATALPRVFSTGFAVDLRELLCAPKLVQAFQSRKKFIGSLALILEQSMS
jgi:hypothetical protein